MSYEKFNEVTLACSKGDEEILKEYGVNKNQSTLTLLQKLREDSNPFFKGIYEETEKIFDIFHNYYKVADELHTLLESLKTERENVAQLTDERAKNGSILFKSLMDICRENKVSPDTAVKTLGYILYAYFEGNKLNDLVKICEEQL